MKASAPDRETSSERSTLDPSEKAEPTTAEPATHGYEIFMDLCERLFDNEVEQLVFEDRVRGIFGNQVSQSPSYREYELTGND